MQLLLNNIPSPGIAKIVTQAGKVVCIRYFIKYVAESHPFPTAQGHFAHWGDYILSDMLSLIFITLITHNPCMSE